MPASLSRALLVLSAAVVLLIAACRRPPETPAPVPPAMPQTDGTLALPGLTAPATVVRDRWGIPHITASNLDDLFFAQGVVQSQDRLFQMDLWRRAAQGRLAETLGANFIERDAMTRRFQFRGRVEDEWAAYGPDARRIATAFTRGINAWVVVARANLPEEFRLAGWQPDTWKPEDLLNRTDAFVASAGALDDLLRARLAAAVGVEAVDRLWPAPDGRTLRAPAEVDLPAITFSVGDTVRRMGTPAFFSALSAKVSDAPRGALATDMAQPPEPSRVERPRIGRENSASGGGDVPLAPAQTADVERLVGEFSLPEHVGSQAWALAPARSATGAPLLAVAATGRLDAPSAWYLVHLSAPGLNVIGATAPWMPGVAAGHNGHIAWAMVMTGLDTQDVFVERVNPAAPHQVERDGRWVDMVVEAERVAVKGRTTPFQIDRLYTSNGAVVGLDRERHLAYTLRWSGTEPGGARQLASLGVNRATTWTEFRSAMERWTAPAATFVYADVDGHIAQVQAGALPSRGSGNGLLPLPGWRAADAWRGTVPAATGSGVQLDPRSGIAAALNGQAARAARLQELLAAPGERTPADVRASLVDAVEPNASRLFPVLVALRDVPEEAERVLTALRSWDGHASSAEALQFEALEREVALRLARRRVPPEFAEDLAARIDVGEVLARPSAIWFDGNVTADRDRVLVEALTAVARAGVPMAPTLTFAHPLAVFDAAKRRFNVGPLARPGAPQALFSTTARTAQTFRAVFDVSDWSRSMATLAPGQSGSPASPHYDDLAASWAAGEFQPLAYTAPDVKAVAVETLVLTPR